MNNKKKSTPSGAPIPEHDYGITPEEKSEAERLFDRIGAGPSRAVPRPKDAKVDRQLRRLIAAANVSGDCIINSGGGYYKPRKEDRAELDVYLAIEMSRAREIQRKVRKMTLSFNRRCQ